MTHDHGRTPSARGLPALIAVSRVMAPEIAINQLAALGA
jgi:hypothetical protein